jgi:hypothetical protein
MRDPFASASLWLREGWSRLKVRSAERRLHMRAVERAVERIIDQANPSLRGLPGYRHKLFPVVERLLAFAAELAGRLPGPTTVDPSSWASDPLVNALFGDVGQIRRVISGAPVRAWIKAHPVPRGDDLYALLAVMATERQQLGMELVGDHVQRDVKQTTLSFAEHELYAVADSMPGCREILAGQIVDLIVSIAIADIVAQEERIAALEQAVRMLRLKLKVLAPRAGSVDLLRSSSENLAEHERLKARIDESQRDLADARRGLGDIEQYLTRLIEQLDHAERHIGLEGMRLWVDRMNVVRDRHDPQAHELQLTRARRPDRPGRVVQFIRFPRRLVQTADERLAEVERHLGM